MWKSRVVGIGLILSMLMAACSRPAVQEVDKWQKLVEETNRTIQMEPLQVTEYSIKVGARLTKPEHKKFAANSSFVISGSVQEYTTMKSDSVWVLIRKMNQNASSVNDDFSYYAPIRDGVFEQNVQLPDGAGEYRVVVRLPSTDSKDRYYDLTEFHVFNVNDEIKRDIAFTMPGRNSGLNISRPETGYSKTEGVFDLQGSILNYPATNRFVMIRLEKDEKKWEHLIPIKEGKFEARLPLHYGLGVHKLTVMAPDPTRKDYFLEAAYLFLDNQSAKTSEPIQYFKTYQERGVRLDTPLTGGEEAQLKYRISGAIDPNVPDADKTTHVIVQTKKDKDVATYLIPVQNYIFDGEIWLRFGRGTYEVTVNVPETNNPLRGYHQFYSVA
ncbi:transglutaminase, partial [Effusibacillus lacus]